MNSVIIPYQVQHMCGSLAMTESCAVIVLPMAAGKRHPSHGVAVQRLQLEGEKNYLSKLDSKGKGN